jgi:hypothetical protein
MAWPKDKREIIEFLEDGIVEVLYVAGYLEGIVGNPQAARCGEKLRNLYQDWKAVRMKQFRQLGFFDDSED